MELFFLFINYFNTKKSGTNDDTVNAQVSYISLSEFHSKAGVILFMAGYIFGEKPQNDAIRLPKQVQQERCEIFPY